jgi:hypothetical protein
VTFPRWFVDGREEGEAPPGPGARRAQPGSPGRFHPKWGGGGGAMESKEMPEWVMSTSMEEEIS